MGAFGLELSLPEAVNMGPQSVLDALWQNKVLILRNAILERLEFIQLGHWFGVLEVHPTLPHTADAPEIAMIETGRSGTPSSEEWHFDSAWGRTPSSVTILRNVTTPRSGGDTLFMDAVALAARMVDHFGAEVRRLRVTYSSAKGTFRASAPLLRRHPETGEWAALVNRHLIRNLECRAHWPTDLLPWLDAEMERPDSLLRVRWLPNSVVIWDNSATLHRLSYDFAPFLRRMERMSVAGHGHAS